MNCTSGTQFGSDQFSSMIVRDNKRLVGKEGFQDKEAIDVLHNFSVEMIVHTLKFDGFKLVIGRRTFI